METRALKAKRHNNRAETGDKEKSQLIKLKLFTLDHPTLTWQQFWRSLPSPPEDMTNQNAHCQSPVSQLEVTFSSLPTSMFLLATIFLLIHKNLPLTELLKWEPKI